MLFVHSQFGRKAPRRSEFFYQSPERYDPNTDLLAIHAGPMSHSVGRVPLHVLLDMHTVLNGGFTIDLKKRVMQDAAEVSLGALLCCSGMNLFFIWSPVAYVLHCGSWPQFGTCDRAASVVAVSCRAKTC
jgi:hypothetical protein